MNILIGADLVPTPTNTALFSAGDAVSLVGESLFDLLNSADHRIFNLEVPLTNICSPIDKNGPKLIAPADAVAGYQALGADCLTLANNHIMDQGDQGLYSTLKALDLHGISYVGGGANLEDAAKPYVFECDGKTIGIYACAEHEFSIAEERSPGANPFDPLESPDHIAALKNRCDFVIVLYHGGKEHYRYPSPSLQKTCHKLVQKGADLVICQHSHCIGCEEKYQHGTIVYGQGNFLFDRSENEFWQTSLLVQIGDDFKISYIPLAKNGCGVRLSDDPCILESFYTRSKEILQEGFIHAQYAALASSMLPRYLTGFSGHQSALSRIINKLSGYRFMKWKISRKYGKKNLLAVRNAIECEAHRELVLYGLTKHK